MKEWNSYALNFQWSFQWGKCVNMIMLSNSAHAWRRPVWLAFGPWLTDCQCSGPMLYPSVFINCRLGAVPVESWGAGLLHCLGGVIRAPTPGEQEPCSYIMTTSWLVGIKLLCLAVWPTPWKMQHHVFGDSCNETFLCLLWSELMAFPLLDGGNSRFWSDSGVFATPPTVLPVWHPLEAITTNWGWFIQRNGF